MIAAAVRGLPDAVGEELRGKAEAYLLEQAELHHAGILAGLAAHLLDVVAPEVAEAKLGEQLDRDEARDATRRNTFTAQPTNRGRISLRGELDPESWSLVAAALEPLSRPASGVDADGIQVRDQRSVGQRQADALVEVCSRTLAAETLPTSGGFPAHVAVTIDYDRLRAGLGVGMLDTGAPIAAEAVRRILCDTGVLPVVLDSTGVPLDGGPTSLDNAVLLCGHHHRVVHRKEWTVRLGHNRRPEFIPSTWIDPDQQPRINTTHLRT